MPFNIQYRNTYLYIFEYIWFFRKVHLVFPIIVDPHNCLAKYFSNIDKIKDRGKEIKRIFEEDITSKNREVFLSVLQKEYDQTEALREITKDIAYHIVAEILPQNKYIANELLVFNKNDSQLIKDTIRYKLSN